MPSARRRSTDDQPAAYLTRLRLVRLSPSGRTGGSAGIPVEVPVSALISRRDPRRGRCPLPIEFLDSFWLVAWAMD